MGFRFSCFVPVEVHGIYPIGESIKELDRHALFLFVISKHIFNHRLKLRVQSAIVDMRLTDKGLLENILNNIKDPSDCTAPIHRTMQQRFINCFEVGTRSGVFVYIQTSD